MMICCVNIHEIVLMGNRSEELMNLLESDNRHLKVLVSQKDIQITDLLSLLEEYKDRVDNLEGKLEHYDSLIESRIL